MSEQDRQVVVKALVPGMSETDELRRMLDERGVEWTNPDTCIRDRLTQWVADGFDYEALETPDGMLFLTAAHQDDLTPEQAIAAALGGGECEMDVLDTGNEAAYEHYEYIMHCANCHHEFGYVQYDEDGDTWMDDKPRFCPNCGKAVKR